MKVLVIRTAPIAQCKRVLESLSQDEQVSEVAVLTHENSVNEFKGSPVKLFTYKAAKVSIFSIGVKLLQQLRREKFERVVLLYNDYSGEHYHAIKILALSLSTKSSGNL